LRIFSRAFDRVHAYELINAGVNDVYREVFSSSLDMGEDVLVALGQNPSEAQRTAKTFKKFDEKVVREQARHAGDTDKMVDIVRTSRAELSRILAGDRNLLPLAGDEVSDEHDAKS